MIVLRCAECNEIIDEDDPDYKPGRDHNDLCGMCNLEEVDHG